MEGQHAEPADKPTRSDSLGVGLTYTHPQSRTSIRQRHLQNFWQLTRHYQASSGKSCAVAAELAGISASYLHDLLSGRRWRVSWHLLRALCENAWHMTEGEGKQLLWLRYLADGSYKQRAYLTREFVWEVAACKHQQIATDIGLDESYLNRILSGRRRPTVEVLMLLYAYMGMDPWQAARLYALDAHRAFARTSTT